LWLEPAQLLATRSARTVLACVHRVCGLFKFGCPMFARLHSSRPPGSNRKPSPQVGTQIRIRCSSTRYLTAFLSETRGRLDCFRRPRVRGQAAAGRCRARGSVRSDQFRHNVRFYNRSDARSLNATCSDPDCPKWAQATLATDGGQNHDGSKGAFGRSHRTAGRCRPCETQPCHDCISRTRKLVVQVWRCGAFFQPPPFGQFDTAGFPAKRALIQSS
jgi:hypothetical protein